MFFKRLLSGIMLVAVSFVFIYLGGKYLVGGIVATNAHEVPIQSQFGIKLRKKSNIYMKIRKIIINNALEQIK